MCPESFRHPDRALLDPVRHALGADRRRGEWPHAMGRDDGRVAAGWISEILLAEFTPHLVTGRMRNSVRGEAAQFRDDFDGTRIFLNNSDFASSFRMCQALT